MVDDGKHVTRQYAADTHVGAEEILKTYNLFTKATWDDSTSVSQATRDAIDLMRQA
jgi:hypothetical protein